MKRLRQQMWNCSLQVSRACKRCHRIRPFQEEFYVNLSRVGTFSLLKVNKNSCLFSFLKNSCLKLFFYGIVYSLCMIPLWLTYNTPPPPSICSKNENKTESFFVLLPVSMHQPAWQFGWATCCGKKYYMHFAISVVHYSRIFFSHSLITIGSGWHQGQAMCVCPD